MGNFELIEFLLLFIIGMLISLGLWLKNILTDIYQKLKRINEILNHINDE